MLHHGIGPNLSFIDKKIQMGQIALLLCLVGLNEQPPNTKVLHTGNVAVSFAFPVDPHPSTWRDP